MPRQYRLTVIRRIINLFTKFSIRFGFAPPFRYLLTIQGRHSGKLYSTPVALVRQGSQRWLVAPYGPVQWVRNVRVRPRATLSRQGRSESVSLIELTPDKTAPILKAYLALEPITQPYFQATPDAPLEAFAQDAQNHPVFQVVSAK